MVFYILMAVSIGGGLAWAILLYAHDKRTLPARLKAFRKKSSYDQAYYGAPIAFFHFWIPIPLMAVSLLAVWIISFWATPVEKTVEDETYSLAAITDKAYLEAGWCNNTKCITYRTSGEGYWTGELEQVYAYKSQITEGASDPTLRVTVKDLYNPSWLAPFGGPPSGSEGNRTTLYDFQVPTGTVAIK